MLTRCLASGAQIDRLGLRPRSSCRKWRLEMLGLERCQKPNTVSSGVEQRSGSQGSE